MSRPCAPSSSPSRPTVPAGLLAGAALCAAPPLSAAHARTLHDNEAWGVFGGDDPVDVNGCCVSTLLCDDSDEMCGYGYGENGAGTSSYVTCDPTEEIVKASPKPTECIEQLGGVNVYCHMWGPDQICSRTYECELDPDSGECFSGTQTFTSVILGRCYDGGNCGR